MRTRTAFSDLLDITGKVDPVYLPTSTGSASSSTHTIAQATHNLTVGQAIRSKGVANQYEAAKADTPDNSEVLGVVTVVTDSNNFTFVSSGEVTVGVPVATAGSPVFLSDSIAGAMTTTEPTAAGMVSKPLGIIVESGAKMIFSIERGIEIGTGTSLYALPANHTAFGNTLRLFNAGEGITIMDAVRLGVGSTWVKTDASAVSTSIGSLGIALQSKNNGELLMVAAHGAIVVDDTWTWTAGGQVYLSTTAGGLTQTQPALTDQVIRVVGYALTSTALHFLPSSDYLTHV